MKLVYLIMSLGLFLNGCASVEQSPVVVASPHIKDKKVDVSHGDLSQRSRQFLYLAAQTAMREGHAALAMQFLVALDRRLKASEDVSERWSIEPRLQLAQLLVQNKQAKRAEALLLPLLAHHPLAADNRVEQLRLHTLYYRVLAALGRQHDGLDGLTKILHFHPDFMPARELQITLFMQTKQWELAHIALQTAIKRHDTAQLRKFEADVYAHEGKQDQALTALDRMQKFAPDDATAALLQSEIESQRGHPASAAGYLRRFIQTHPENLAVKNALAALLIQAGQLDAGIKIYQALEKALPDRAEIPSALGVLFYQQKKFTLALGYFEKAFQLAPQGDGHAFYLAATLDALGKQVRAQSLYLQVLEQDRLWPEAQLRLARIDFANKQFDLVEKRLKVLLKRDSKDQHAWIMLSASYLNRKQYQQLLDETDAVAAMGGTSARLMMNRAIAFEHFKRYEAVERTLQKVIAAYPDDAEALNFLGYTYAEQGVKLDAAEKYIQRALKYKPSDGYYLDSLAWVYYQRGDYVRAIETQRQSLKIVGDDAMMQEHLGDMLWKHGDHEGALKQWRKALDMGSKRPDVLQYKIKSGL